MSADPDDNLDAFFDEPPVSVSDTVLVYQADEADSPNNSGVAAQDEELYGDDGTDTDYGVVFNPNGYLLEENSGDRDVDAQIVLQTSVTLTSTIPAPVYVHNLLNDGTSLITSAGNYYQLTEDSVGADTLNALNSAANLTIAATFNVDSVSGWHYIAANDCPTNQGAEVFLRIRDGKLQFGYWDTKNNYMAETAVAAGVLYDVVGAFDGTSWKLYVNGELKHTKTYTPPGGITDLDVRNNGSTSSWFVGRHGTPSDLRIFGGTLYNVAIWDTALSTEEIAAKDTQAVSVEAESFYAVTTDIAAYWGNTETIAAVSLGDRILQIAYSQIVSDNFLMIDTIQGGIEGSLSSPSAAYGSTTTVTDVYFCYDTVTAEWTLFYSVSTFEFVGYALEDKIAGSVTGGFIAALSSVSFLLTNETLVSLIENDAANGVPVPAAADDEALQATSMPAAAGGISDPVKLGSPLLAGAKAFGTSLLRGVSNLGKGALNTAKEVAFTATDIVMVSADTVCTLAGNPINWQEISSQGRSYYDSNASDIALNAGRSGLANGTLGVSEIIIGTYQYTQDGDADAYQQHIGGVAAGNLLAAGAAKITGTNPKIEFKKASAASNTAFKDLMFPEEEARYEKYWQDSNLKQYTPGIKSLTREQLSQNRKYTYISKSYFDEFGRLIADEHHTTHPSTGILHPNPHYHRFNPSEWTTVSYDARRISGRMICI